MILVLEEKNVDKIKKKHHKIAGSLPKRDIADSFGKMKVALWEMHEFLRGILWSGLNCH